MSYSNCLIIGAGSIGMNHCRIAIDMFEQVYVVDPLERARANISSRFPNAKVKETLTEAFDDLYISDTLSVIANWGTGHFKSFGELVDRGISAVLCEKPFAHSASAIRQMVKTAQSNDVDLRINHHRRYTGLAKIIRDKFADLNDECHMIVVHGGAQCVVTNGMHWLDLAGDVFLEDPISVFADLSDSRINPRSSTLGFWEGCAGWSFDKNKKFVISMTNQSRVSSKIIFYSRNARLDFIPGDGIYFGKMDPTKDLPVTRTAGVEPVRISKDISTFDVTREILRQMKSRENRSAHLEKHATLTEAMIGALVSSKRESKIYLPLVSTDLDIDTAWDIS